MSMNYKHRAIIPTLALLEAVYIREDCFVSRYLQWLIWLKGSNDTTLTIYETGAIVS